LDDYLLEEQDDANELYGTAYFIAMYALQLANTWLLNRNIFCYSRLSNCDKDFFTFSLCLSNQFCSEKCFLHWIKFTEMTKTDIVHLQNTEQNGPFRNLFFTIVHISELCSPLCYLSNILCKTANFLLILQNRLNEQK
jgi:hypothetical protein